jgi:hypothetical protein
MCTPLLPTLLCVQALELPNPAEPIRGLIKALFDQCERDKPKVQPNEPLDKEYCKNFALTVFSRADKLDRAKRADINTAKCYYAAAIFLQVRSLNPLAPSAHILSAGFRPRSSGTGLQAPCETEHTCLQQGWTSCVLPAV